jgi:hypothetical protein
MEAIFFPLFMEFLFTNQVASIEAIILFLCIGLIALMFAHDAYQFLKRIFYLFHPRKAYVMENSIPITETPEEIPTETKMPEETPQIPEAESSLEIAQTEPLPLEPTEASETTPENSPETVEVVSPFLDEPLITTTETTTPDDSTIEQIIENAEAPEEILEIPEEKIEDDTDLI